MPLLNLDPVFVTIVYTILAIICATILGAGAAVLAIEFIAEIKEDWRFKQRKRPCPPSDPLSAPGAPSLWVAPSLLVRQQPSFGTFARLPT